MKNKRAQMKMGETIAVLIVFFILLFFGIIFFSNMERRDIQDKVSNMGEQASIDIAQTIQFLPELKCTSEDITRTLCLDTLKLESFKLLSSEKKAYYQSVFGSTGLEIAEIYPEYTNYTTIYGGPTSSEYFVTFIPVSLFQPYPYPGEYKIGMLKIISYTFST